MPSVSNEKLSIVSSILYMETYETSFGGKTRGKFRLSRGQMKEMLNVTKLHDVTISRLQEEALRRGLIIIYIDDEFACIELSAVRRFRAVPTSIIRKQFDLDTAEDTSFDTEAAEGEDN